MDEMEGQSSILPEEYSFPIEESSFRIEEPSFPIEESSFCIIKWKLFSKESARVADDYNAYMGKKHHIILNAKFMISSRLSERLLAQCNYDHREASGQRTGRTACL